MTTVRRVGVQEITGKHFSIDGSSPKESTQHSQGAARANTSSVWASSFDLGLDFTEVSSWNMMGLAGMNTHLSVRRLGCKMYFYYTQHIWPKKSP